MSSDNPFQNPNAMNRNRGGEFNSPGQFGGGPPPKKSNVWLWVLGTIGVLAVVGGLVCCGGSYMMFRFGQGMMADEITRQIGNDPLIVEHIGTISSASMNLTETGNAANANRPGSIAFDIQGDKGSAVLIVQQDPSSQGSGFTLRSAELVLPDGTRHQLIPVDNAGVAPIEGAEVTPIEIVAPQSESPDMGDFRVRDIESLQPAN